MKIDRRILPSVIGHQSMRLLFLLVFFGFIYVADLNSSSWAALQTGKMIALFVVAFGLMQWRRTREMLSIVGKQCQRFATLPDYLLVGALAVIYVILTASLSQILFEGLPHVADTHSQYVHAKIFASGHLYLASHPLARFFDFQTMVNDGRYYSVYAPGHIALLALGYALGFAWMVNPLSGGLTVIGVYLLGREIGGKSAGYIASALMLTSPFMVFMSSEFMNNVTCELFLTFFLFTYIRQHKTQDIRYALMAGCCVGYAFITRPQSTLPFALPVAAHALAALIKSPKTRWKNTLCLTAIFLLWVGLLLYYNALMNDNPFVQSRTDPLIFLRPFMSWSAIEPHLANDIDRLRRTISALHQQLFGWPFSSLIFVLLLFALRGQKRYSGLLIACCLGQLASLIINPFYSGIFGPRYLYETSTSLIVLTALCWVRLPALLRKRLHWHCRLSAVQGSVVLLWAMFFILALPVHIIPLYKTYKNDYHEGNMTFTHKLMNSVQPPALVFFNQYETFRWLYFTMPPAPENPMIAAQNRGKENQKLIDFYPDRSVYSVDKGVITKIK